MSIIIILIKRIAFPNVTIDGCNGNEGADVQEYNNNNKHGHLGNKYKVMNQTISQIARIRIVVMIVSMIIRFG